MTLEEICEMPALNSFQRRRVSVPVQVGNVIIGGSAPIAVQSMTDTPTENIDATVKQILALTQAGSELVRLTVNTEAAAEAIAPIRDKLAAKGCTVPLIGDFHYNGHRLLQAHPACAEALAKYRINPGNVGFKDKRDKQFASMIETAIRYDKPVRIGVNWGSLDSDLIARLMDENAKRTQPKSAKALMHDALIQSALESAGRAEQLGLARDKIILSCKVSGVQDLISVYQRLAGECDYALHLGLTEAGMGSKGMVASAIAMGVLLQSGIGDTLRTSLTPEPGAPRTKEVVVSQEILQTMGLRSFAPMVAACPGCGRTTSSYFRELAETIQHHVRDKMPEWRDHYPGVENLQLAVMGCVVNGPGESKHADIGISLPGTGEAPVAPVFIDGEKAMTLRGDDIAGQFQQIVEDYVVRRYGTH